MSWLLYLWFYPALVWNVVDGDTLDAKIDLGFTIRVDQRVRLIVYDASGVVVGVDTPEIRSRDEAERVRAQAAKAYVQTWLASHAAHNHATLNWSGETAAYFVIRTERDPDSFGRYLGDIRCQEGHSLGQDLLDSGHAVVWSP